MNNLLKGVNLYLIGMMGCGKTTVGNLLASELGYRFIDTDDVIVKAAGKSISQIFAEDGEKEFRQLESSVLSQICAYTNLVIATGGGIVMQKLNWSYLHHGIIVWLDAPIEVLYERLILDDTRPLLQNTDLKEKLRSLLSERRGIYAQADLHIHITPEQTPMEITQHILATIPSILRSEVTEKLEN